LQHIFFIYKAALRGGEMLQQPRQAEIPEAPSYPSHITAVDPASVGSG